MGLSNAFEIPKKTADRPVVISMRMRNFGSSAIKNIKPPKTKNKKPIYSVKPRLLLKNAVEAKNVAIGASAPIKGNAVEASPREIEMVKKSAPKNQIAPVTNESKKIFQETEIEPNGIRNTTAKEEIADQNAYTKGSLILRPRSILSKIAENARTEFEIMEIQIQVIIPYYHQSGFIFREQPSYAYPRPRINIRYEK